VLCPPILISDSPGISEFPKAFFPGLQADYDLMQRKRKIGAELATIQPRGN